MNKKCGLLLLVAAFSGWAYGADQPARQLTFERGSDVWLASIEGTSAKKIARGQSPELSPDGTRLAYNTVQQDGQPAYRQIAVYRLADGTTQVLKDIPSTNCMAARWSPDGKKLLFDFYVDNERRIGLVNADDTGFRYVQESEPKHRDYWASTWAADGQSFFAEDMTDLYQLDLNAKVLKQWSIEKLIPHGGMSGDVRFDASPDGKTLLMDIEMDEKARPGWDGPPSSIWLLDLATEKATRLTPKGLYAWDCHWLEAPHSILCLSQKPGDESPSVYRMSVTGQGKDRQLLVKNARSPGTSR